MTTTDLLTAIYDKPADARVYYDGIEMIPDKLTFILPTKETLPTMPETGLGLKPNQDNTRRLQDIINEYANAKQKLVLPEGVFLSNRLIFPSNLEIEGRNTEPILIGSSDKEKELVYIDKGANNIISRNLIFNGNRRDNPGKSLSAVFVHDDVKKLKWIGCTFKGSRDIGTLTLKGYGDGNGLWLIEDVEIIKCSFMEAGMANLEMRGVKNGTILACTFTGYGVDNKKTQSIQLQSVVCSNIDIDGNVFYNTHCDQFAIESAEALAEYISVTGNEFNDVSGLGGIGISGPFNNSSFKCNKFIGGIGNHRSGLEIFGSGNKIGLNTGDRGAIVVAGGRKMNGQAVPTSRGGTKVYLNTFKSSGDNSPAFVVAGSLGSESNKAWDIVQDDVRARINTFDSSAAKGSSSFSAVIGKYGEPSKIANIIVEDNEFKSNKDSTNLLLSAKDGSSNVVITKNTMRDGYAYANYKTDAIDGLIVDDNELIGMKQNNIYISGSIKTTKAKKLQ